jgi:hypothetical protein
MSVIASFPESTSVGENFGAWRAKHYSHYVKYVSIDSDTRVLIHDDDLCVIVGGDDSVTSVYPNLSTAFFNIVTKQGDIASSRAGENATVGA